ncbi:oligosaccharide flippase family protein [Flavobacterium capsici]|uniref:Oligosaccharide flippase family protein n=1 Tax=Flavobacterium capsici TaxID=3075618 RepID=A0AA96EXD9_9FLAO|nr:MULTISPECIES: oligosaccharide flippase family protein [unclassified Flavobacterium]WNM18752.1 oligosaccharide flippase family protein [Flavobacterium sp. PMR2A8]WNM22803.1 oligosaccharide flippase family protein [Flavobacterium sp. PMTSA4]
MSLEINKSYRSIMKATGVFGMMQVFRTIISIISSKVVAIYIGPIGIGLVSLLTNSVNIITAITNFEFLTVATREVALVSGDEDKSKLSNTISMLQKMAIIIGVLGALISFIFSSYLSDLTFGNKEKQHWFQLLAVYFLIVSFTNTRMAILQGVNKIKALAVCNIVAAFFIAIGTIIIYYYLRIEGIIWVMMYSSIVLLLVTLYFTRQYSIKILPFNFNEFYEKSSPIFKFGFFMSINLILGQIANFCIKLYLNDDGNFTQILGYYEVSSVILINYLGLIFNAMAYDFYPKLTALSSDNSKVKQVVNHQIEIALILVTPAIIMLYMVAPLMIELLYTKEFLSAFSILKFALFSIILKAVVFPIGYIILVKGDKKIFFKQALFSDILNFVLSIVLYKYYGLLGLGLAYFFNYLFYLIYVYQIVKKNYEFSFSNSCKKLILMCCSVGFLAIVSVYFLDTFYANCIISILVIISIIFSCKELNQRIDFKDILNRRRKK